MIQEIDVLIVEPGRVPRQAKINGTMEAFTGVVGGPVEIGCFLPQRVMLVSNSEAKKRGLPVNRRNPGTREEIAGTFLLCSFEGNRFTSLSPAQCREFQHRFALNRR